jgi:hypothetical protein
MSVWQCVIERMIVMCEPVIPRVYEFCIESARIHWPNVIAGGLEQSQPEEKLCPG